MVEKIRIAKIDAARRQLETALELWFSDRDPVSIFTLTFAAYEVVHFVTAKRGRTRDLLFDSLVVKDEFRKDWNRRLREPANFFKHADRDADAELEFAPAASDIFILATIAGLQSLGERPSPLQSAFTFWTAFHKPNFLTDAGRKQYLEPLQGADLEHIRRIPKSAFAEVVARALAVSS